LYCGKEIGAFRLLRDSEFCSALHRKKYGDRLDKALHEIAVPEAAPAGIAGFRDQMPLQQGNTLSTLVLWQTGNGRRRTWTGVPWPLTIATSEAADEPAPTPAAAPLPTPTECPPPLCEQWMSAPAPEPVAAFVQVSAALAPATTLRVPGFATGLQPVAKPDHAQLQPAACQVSMPAPAPEPVTAFVQASAALTPVQTIRLPRFDGEIGPAPFLDPLLEQALDTPNVCERWMPGPGPEPVAIWIQAAASLIPALAIRLPRLGKSAPSFHLAGRAESPAPEPVAAFVQSAASLIPVCSPYPLRMIAGMEPEHIQYATLAVCNRWMPATEAVVPAALAEVPEPPATLHTQRPAPHPQIPAPQFAAFLEPLPSLDELLDPPAMCERWMPSPAADPVFSYLRSSSAQAVTVQPELTLPAFALSLADTHMPRVSRSKTIPTAEVVMSVILPSAENAPVAPIRQKTAVALPALVGVATESLPAATVAACAPPPAAVESWLAAALVSVPLSIKHTALTGAELAEPPAVSQPAPALCRPVAGLAPDALESFLVPSVAAALQPTTALYLPVFAMSAARDRAVPIYGARSLAPAVTKPTTNPVRLAALQPMTTLAVASPEETHRALEPALPRPGLLPVEFHTHRPRTTLVARPEWVRSHSSLEAPRFLLQPVLEKLESAAQQKPTRKENVVELRNMPTGKRPPAVLMAVGRIAAMLVMGISLWFATASFLGERRLAREVSSGAALSAAANTGSAGANGAAAQRASTGPVARVKQAIADRAALRIAENFRDMDSWDAAEKARPAGWNRHQDGYMNTGSLALFRPTLKFTDYRMEFFGQIESKSIGWTVHSTDTRNYHAMKLTVVEAGIRPFVALVQYNVVDGKSKHRTQTPLNVMVHNNRPLQFAVDVHGSRIVTSINGEEVDSFIDGTLVAGGVGFFSDAGERARLYWMKVSRNDDWLGHVCAMLAEGAGASSAEVRRPQIPGNPLPGLPGEPDGMTLSAMWIALPYLGATRKARFFKTRRSEPWNM
jgi:hypothetical protein